MDGVAVLYECSSGYSITNSTDTNTTITCNSGSWSGTVPTCSLIGQFIIRECSFNIGGKGMGQNRDKFRNFS